MKQYNRIMLGSGGKYAEECYKGNFIGADFDIDIDLTGKFPDNWRLFNKKFIPIWFEKNPGKSKISAGLACGMLWTITRGLKIDDIVLCPDGQGNYYVGTITGDYSYHPEQILQHRRAVNWLNVAIERSAMSDALRKSAGSGGTTCDLSSHAEEIERFIGGKKPPKIICMDDTIEDPSVFALEKHLEDFLVKNWNYTALGKKYMIFEDNGELIGQQYPSDTGPIDILAISKDKKTLLVIELKKGRATDVVVGQFQRYMGYVKDELAERLEEAKDDFKDEQQIEYLNKIEESAVTAGILFTWDFDEHIHARHIALDTGWKILLDRGLDIFQHYEMNDTFSFDNHLQKFRSCKAFEVTYVKESKNKR